MRFIVLFFLISSMLTACGTKDISDQNTKNAENKIHVISTIKPIQAIVYAITGEHAISEKIIPENASPHHYSFKPSDIRKIKKADIVFRIDEHMETRLNSLFKDLDKSTTLVSLSHAKGLQLLNTRDSHHKESAHNHGHYENTDFHIWTSPKNAIVIAKEITNNLIKIDIKNTDNYNQNLRAFIREVQSEAELISTALAPLRNKPYIVFHDSWQYFAKEFGLNKPIVVDLHEGISRGAKTIGNIRTIISEENIQCIFNDSSTNITRVRTLSDKVTPTEIDLLAKKIANNQKTYVLLLKQLGIQVKSCLAN